MKTDMDIRRIAEAPIPTGTVTTSNSRNVGARRPLRTSRMDRSTMRTDTMRMDTRMGITRTRTHTRRAHARQAGVFTRHSACMDTSALGRAHTPCVSVLNLPLLSRRRRRRSRTTMRHSHSRQPSHLTRVYRHHRTCSALSGQRRSTTKVHPRVMKPPRAQSLRYTRVRTALLLAARPQRHLEI